MVAINSAIEIDLTGQVCADSIGSRMYSGVGGQMDFVRGAALADDGRAIICLPSTAGGGTASRIVPYLHTGAGVVTTRAHVETIVTEFGIAEMHGRSIRERARQLIAISDPRFRDELEVEARKAHFISPADPRSRDSGACYVSAPASSGTPPGRACGPVTTTSPTSSSPGVAPRSTYQ